MEQQSTARMIGAVYLALTQGLSEQGVELANDVLYAIADRSPSHEANVLRSIADSCVSLSAPPALEVIEGDAA